jgi:Tfp pilus assembly protein PilO
MNKFSQQSSRKESLTETAFRPPFWINAALLALALSAGLAIFNYIRSSRKLRKETDKLLDEGLYKESSWWSNFLKGVTDYVTGANLPPRTITLDLDKLGIRNLPGEETPWYEKLGIITKLALGVDKNSLEKLQKILFTQDGRINEKLIDQLIQSNPNDDVYRQLAKYKDPKNAKVLYNILEWSRNLSGWPIYTLLLTGTFVSGWLIYNLLSKFLWEREKRISEEELEEEREELRTTLHRKYGSYDGVISIPMEKTAVLDTLTSGWAWLLSIPYIREVLIGTIIIAGAYGALKGMQEGKEEREKEERKKKQKAVERAVEAIKLRRTPAALPLVSVDDSI